MLYVRGRVDLNTVVSLVDGNSERRIGTFMKSYFVALPQVIQSFPEGARLVILVTEEQYLQQLLLSLQRLQRYRLQNRHSYIIVEWASVTYIAILNHQCCRGLDYLEIVGTAVFLCYREQKNLQKDFTWNLDTNVNNPNLDKYSSRYPKVACL